MTNQKTINTNAQARWLSRKNRRQQDRIESLETALGSMVSAIDVIWSEQAFPKSKSSQIHNYDKAIELLKK